MPNQNPQPDNENQKPNPSPEIRKAETQIRQTEDASLPDESYAFDEANTDNEEYHDVDDEESESGDLTDLFQSTDDLQ